MTEKEAYGQAFENGRKVGYEEGKRDAVKHGRWEYAGVSNGRKIYRCTNCKTLTYGTGKYCNECGTRMDGGNDG